LKLQVFIPLSIHIHKFSTFLKQISVRIKKAALLEEASCQEEVAEAASCDIFRGEQP
jgi:hypothetical protein